MLLSINRVDATKEYGRFLVASQNKSGLNRHGRCTGLILAKKQSGPVEGLVRSPYKLPAGFVQGRGQDDNSPLETRMIVDW